MEHIKPIYNWFVNFCHVQNHFSRFVSKMMKIRYASLHRIRLSTSPLGKFPTSFWRNPTIPQQYPKSILFPSNLNWNTLNHLLHQSSTILPYSSQSIIHNPDDSTSTTTATLKNENSPINQSKIIQSSIQSRRTISNFDPCSSDNKTPILSAIQRAIQCARTAPNHKRTEPTSYKVL